MFWPGDRYCLIHLHFQAPAATWTRADMWTSIVRCLTHMLVRTCWTSTTRFEPPDACSIPLPQWGAMLEGPQDSSKIHYVLVRHIHQSQEVTLDHVLGTLPCGPEPLSMQMAHLDLASASRCHYRMFLGQAGVHSPGGPGVGLCLGYQSLANGVVLSDIGTSSALNRVSPDWKDPEPKFCRSTVGPLPGSSRVYIRTLCTLEA